MVSRTIRVRSWLPLVLVPVLFVLQLFTPARAILFVLVALTSAILLSYIWARQLCHGVSIQRLRRYGWAQVGDILQERWILHNDAWVPLLWAEVHEHSDLVGYDATRAVGLGARSSQRWTTQGTCRRRGVFTLGPLKVTMGDPFGFFDVELRDAHVDSFVVYPAVVSLPQLLEERGLDRGSARPSTQSLTFTPNAVSVRPYVAGDALKRIHWRSTARRSMPGAENLMVKVYDREPSGDLWIVLDMQAQVHAGKDEESTEEYAVTLAASLAAQMLQANRAVGLVTHTDDPIIIPPRRRQEQLWDLLRVLAPIHATSSVPLRELLALAEPVLSRNMIVAVITPSADAAWIDGLGALLMRGIVPSALLLDGASFGAEAGVRGVQAALADLGVPAHVIGRGELPMSPAGDRSPQYRVLGTGRVVMVNPRPPAEWVPVGTIGGE